MYMEKKILYVVLCVTTMHLTAQQKDTIKYIELPATVITSQKVKQGSSVQAIQIQKMNTGKDVPQLVNTLPSVVTTSDAGNSVGYSSLRLRGTDITRLNVTLNGVPVNDAESSSVYFVDFPDIASSANSIQIKAGVKNSKNGASNFGGAIEINTLETKENALCKYSFDYGSFNTRKHSILLNTGLLHNKFIGSVRISDIQSNGYIQRSAADLKAMQLVGKYYINASNVLTATIIKGKEITQQAWNGVSEDSLKTNRTFNELGIKADGSFYNNQIDNYKQDYYQLFFDNKINNKWSTSATLFFTKGKGYYEEYKLAQDFNSYGLNAQIHGADTITNTDLIRQLWLDNNFYGGRFSVTYHQKKSQIGVYINASNYDGNHFGKIIWAKEYIPNNYQWYTLHSNKKEWNNYIMYHYIHNSKIQVVADAQVRLVDYTIHGFRHNPTLHQNVRYTFFNPKVKWIITPNSNNEIICTSGIAQKEPNRDDIEAGKNNIPTHEKLWDTEIEYENNSIRNFLVQANVYYMQYHNQLVLTGKINDVGAYTRSNIKESSRVGLELMLQYKYKSNIEVFGNIALSKNTIHNFEEYIDDYDNGVQKINKYNTTTIAFSPSIVSSIAVQIKPFSTSKVKYISGTTFSLINKYVSKQYLDNTSNASNITKSYKNSSVQESKLIKPYTTTDVLLHIPLVVSNNNIQLRFVCYNVLNKLFETNGYTYSYIYGLKTNTYNYYYPQAGRHYSIGATIEIN